MSDDVGCPFCGHQNDSTDYTENWRHDGDSFVIECSNCEEELSLTARVDITYEVRN
ncbi:hypothetical protein Acj61p087 [Acinetobacter phage Acj61]|uniref:Uncharacterized protein n=1 Tax=Acinetobacter phage Acj61 TaxID=760732 RepID=E5E468_9CAUD|nr:hypothetical protein Acj61p087 [Acinetobacter phage Acj61]ADG36052.1 hypothetical protein Acj61p087 [Acinetobacter phage Acj61]